MRDRGALRFAARVALAVGWAVSVLLSIVAYGRGQHDQALAWGLVSLPWSVLWIWFERR